VLAWAGGKSTPSEPTGRERMSPRSPRSSSPFSWQRRRSRLAARQFPCRCLIRRSRSRCCSGEHAAAGTHAYGGHGDARGCGGAQHGRGRRLLLDWRVRPRSHAYPFAGVPLRQPALHPLSGAMVAQRRIAEGRVKILNENLERSVASRTAELEESRSRYRELASIAPVGIFRMDAEKQIIYVNEKWCDMAGISAEKAQGQGWLAAVHPMDRGRVLEDCRSGAPCATSISASRSRMAPSHGCSRSLRRNSTSASSPATSAASPISPRGRKRSSSSSRPSSSSRAASASVPRSSASGMRS